MLSAFRQDVADQGVEGAGDSRDWLSVAVAVEHAALLPADEREAAMRTAAALAEETVGSETLRARIDREWPSMDPAPIDVLIAAAHLMHNSGAHHLAGATLDVLKDAYLLLDPTHLGRILIERAKVDRKLKRQEDAADRYRYVETFGSRHKIPELRARALIGLAALAQAKGNYPEVQVHAEKAAKLAERHGLRHLAAEARNGAMVATGQQHRFDEAIVHGWAAYHAAAGDTLEESGTLLNLGQLLLEAGLADEARAAFSVVLSRRLPAIKHLPALGGLAVASARCGRSDLVKWAASETQRLRNAIAPRQALAVAFLECAIGLMTAGFTAEAEHFREDALKLGREYQFHEVVFRADDLAATVRAEVPRPSQNFGRPASTAVREIGWLEPEELPEHVALATSGSVAP